MREGPQGDDCRRVPEERLHLACFTEAPPESNAEAVKCRRPWLVTSSHVSVPALSSRFPSHVRERVTELVNEERVGGRVRREVSR